MSAETTLSTLSDLVQIAVAAAEFGREDQIDLRKVTTVYGIPEGRASLRVPKFSTTVAETVAEGAQGTNVALTSTSGALLEPNDATAFRKFVIGDISQTTTSIMYEQGRSAAASIQMKVNQTIAATFPSFSTSKGHMNVNCTVANVDAAVDTLVANDVPGPYYFVTTPNVARKWLTDLETNYDTLVPETVKSGIFAGNIGTMPVRSVIPVVVGSGVTNTGSNHHSAVLSSEALAYGFLEGKEFVSKTIEDETSTKVVVYHPFDVKIKNQDCGVKIISKAS